ncbi:hypothetical protein [Paenibacillus sp. 22594]|uniref:hypothetical protein n=1 Tax=Paenibacillus sp. 22594 TaxID=3453947 RepID=UPI003F85275C
MLRPNREKQQSCRWFSGLGLTDKVPDTNTIKVSKKNHFKQDHRIDGWMIKDEIDSMRQ